MKGIHWEEYKIIGCSEDVCSDEVVRGWFNMCSVSSAKYSRRMVEYMPYIRKPMSSCDGLSRSPVNLESYFLYVLPNKIEARAVGSPKLAFIIRESCEDIARNIRVGPPDAQTKAVESFDTES